MAEDKSLSRRKAIKLVGAAGSASLAGCTGGGGGNGNGNGNGNGDGGGSSQLGERVPTFELWVDPSRRKTEIGGPIVVDAMSELGVKVEQIPTEWTPQWADMFNDKRTVHGFCGLHSGTPDRLSPQEMTRRYAADWAGANGLSNPFNYANCDYTDMAIGHGGAESEEERREMVYEALDIMGQDGGIIPYSTSAEFSVVNTDYLNPQGVGSVGFLSVNVNSFAKTELEQGDKIISQASVLLSEDVVWHESNHSNVIVVGSNFFHSPLIGLDENGEAEPVLAESWEERESGTVIEFSLFEDAVFHNGDQITSEDVKFTWDLMQKWADHVNKYSRMEALESIEAPDDRTVIFNFSDPYRPFMGKEIFKWGILHKPSWEEAMEVGIRDFEWESPKIGSGPYKYEHWELGDDFIAGSPHEDHPSKVPNHPFEFQLFREPTTALQAFTNEEIHAMQSIAFGITQRAIDQLGDPAQRISGLAVLASPVYIHWAFGPGKFVPFRKAVGTGINRERIYEVEFGGELEPHMAASIFTSEHPWSLPEDRMQDIKFTDDPSGDIDAARAKLQDAGFGWDDEGRLHYPPDADLSPRWPQGEIPSPEYGFNCLDSDSNWVPPEQR